jgi:hypothetical protein
MSKENAPKGVCSVLRKCVWCGRWTPDRQVASIVRVGGKCEYKGDTRLDETCWGWKKCTPEQEESRRKAGLIE